MSLKIINTQNHYDPYGKYGQIWHFILAFPPYSQLKELYLDAHRL